jgi:hypothetical protein
VSETLFLILWLFLGIQSQGKVSNLIVVSAGAFCQLLHDGGSEVAAHHEVDHRIEDGVDEREQEQTDPSPVGEIG